MYFDVDYNINFMLKLGPTDSMQLEFLDYDSIWKIISCAEKIHWLGPMENEKQEEPPTLLTVTQNSHDAYLQRVSTACYAERCTSYSKSVRPSVHLSVRHTLALCQNDSGYDHAVFTVDYDSLTTLVSSRLTSPQNSKGNIGSEGAEWERGVKNRQFLAIKSPYLRRWMRWELESWRAIWWPVYVSGIFVPKIVKIR